jgi:2-methylisocitrate lyase-like PEP mutase family enzyme
MSSKTKRLREILNSEGESIAMGCVSVLSARINERAGYPALYIGGHALGSLHYAVPDYGVLSPSEMVEQSGRIARSVSIPTVVDADELGGNVGGIYRWIREYEAAGVSGIHMEDEYLPKHSNWIGGLLSVEDMQARIATAADARTDPDFIIVARCNEVLNGLAYGTGSLEAAIERCIAYAEAGADTVVVPGITPEQGAIMAPLMPVPYSTMGVSAEGSRLNMAVLGNHDGMYERWAKVLFENGELPREAYAQCDDLYGLLDEPHYDEVVRTWAERSGLPTGPSLHAANLSAG